MEVEAASCARISASGRKVMHQPALKMHHIILAGGSFPSANTFERKAEARGEWGARWWYRNSVEPCTCMCYY